mmetsp:Transcript_50018/g.99635  ORF Transcript_50018/g.99635 Transcript_50018/m.99635 type:complete len:338 (-) Transcript_50018:300-1313(-)
MQLHLPVACFVSSESMQPTGWPMKSALSSNTLQYVHAYTCSLATTGTGIGTGTPTSCCSPAICAPISLAASVAPAAVAAALTARLALIASSSVVSACAMSALLTSSLSSSTSLSSCSSGAALSLAASTVMRRSHSLRDSLLSSQAAIASARSTLSASTSSRRASASSGEMASSSWGSRLYITSVRKSHLGGAPTVSGSPSCMSPWKKTTPQPASGLTRWVTAESGVVKRPCSSMWICWLSSTKRVQPPAPSGSSLRYPLIVRRDRSPKDFSNAPSRCGPKWPIPFPAYLTMRNSGLIPQACHVPWSNVSDAGRPISALFLSIITVSGTRRCRRCHIR